MMSTIKKLRHKGLALAITFSTLLGMAGSAGVALAAPMDMGMGSSTYQVMIMTHLCNSSIKNVADFEAMESGKDPIRAIAEDVLACPTTGLAANAATAGSIASPRSMYDFTVSGDSMTKMLSTQGTFMPVKLCEADVHLDLNGDGQMATSTCLDISHYMIPITNSNSSSTLLRVNESMAPAGFHFGTMRFTPVSLINNNDSESLTFLNSQTGEMHFNMVPDKDGMLMLHVYQFQNGTTIGNDMGNGMGTSTASTTNSGSGTIDQNNTTVRAGTTLGFSGRNFGHEENVAVKNNNEVIVATAHADGGGNFSTGSIMAPTTPGMYMYHFAGLSSGMHIHTMVTVTP